MTKSTGKDETIATAGIIGNVRVLKSKRGDFYAQATLEDMSGSIDMIVFPEAYKRLGDKVKLEVPVLVRAGVRIEEGANPKITAAEIMPLEDAKVPLPRAFAFACRSKPPPNPR
jgi:DNA polymerase III subunit alpha